MLEKSFGEKKENINYTDRVGAYAVIFSGNKIAVVKTSTGYFLLGGGIDALENYEECIKRECLEEAGLSIKVNDFICKGDSYRWSDTLKYYMHIIGYFYFADLIEKSAEPTEEDHELVWLDIEDCCEKLFLEHQAWAVKQAVLSRNS